MQVHLAVLAIAVATLLASADAHSGCTVGMYYGEFTDIDDDDFDDSQGNTAEARNMVCTRRHRRCRSSPAQRHPA